MEESNLSSTKSWKKASEEVKYLGSWQTDTELEFTTKLLLLKINNYGPAISFLSKPGTQNKIWIVWSLTPSFGRE